MLQLPPNDIFDVVANFAFYMTSYEHIFLSSHLDYYFLGDKKAPETQLGRKYNIRDYVIDVKGKLTQRVLLDISGLEGLVAPGDIILQFHLPIKDICPYPIKEGVVDYIELLEVDYLNGIIGGHNYYSIDVEIRRVQAYEVRVVEADIIDSDYTHNGKNYRFKFTRIEPVRITEINIPLEFIKLKDASSVRCDSKISEKEFLSS